MRPRLVVAGTVVLVGSGIAVLSQGAFGLGGASGGGSATTVPVPNDARTNVERDTFTGDEERLAESLAEDLAALLVADNPDLAGLTVTSTSPVFTETSTEPVGTMATLAVPAVVASTTIDVIRSTRDGIETIPSRVENLRTIDTVIYFDTEEIVHLLPAPSLGDVDNPDAATRVTPIDPEEHRDPRFGGNE